MAVWPCSVLDTGLVVRLRSVTSERPYITLQTIHYFHGERLFYTERGLLCTQRGWSALRTVIPVPRNECTVRSFGTNLRSTSVQQGLRCNAQTPSVEKNFKKFTKNFLVFFFNKKTSNQNHCKSLYELLRGVLWYSDGRPFSPWNRRRPRHNGLSSQRSV